MQLGNHRTVEIIGMGNVRVKTETGCILVLKNVWHVPKICLNLISVGALDDDDYQNYFGNGQWKLMKGLLIVANEEKSSNLYVMQVAISKDNLNVVVGWSTDLRHVRSGHRDEMDAGVLANDNPRINDTRKEGKTMQEGKSALQENDLVMLMGQLRAISHPSCTQSDVKEFSRRKVSFVEIHADGIEPAMMTGNASYKASNLEREN